MPGFYTIKKDTFRNKYAVRNVLPFKNVYYLKADGSYTQVFDENNEKITISYRLGIVQEKMNCLYFFRCHDSYSVNLLHVKNIVKPTDGYSEYYVELTNGVRIKCSRKLVDELDDRLTAIRSQISVNKAGQVA